MTRLLGPEEAELLRESEVRQSLTFAVAFAMVGIILVVGTGAFARVLVPDIAWLVTVAAFAVGGGVVMLVLILGFRRGRRHIADVVDMWREWVKSETTPPALPVTLPALPAETRVIPVTTSERVGEVAIDLLHGFDPRDLEWLCRYLANGGKFTESAMEFIPLPYSLELMGKAQENTNYTRFMRLCVDAGVIVGREGKKSGTLAVTNYTEIVRRIKELPESIDPARAG